MGVGGAAGGEVLTDGHAGGVAVNGGGGGEDEVLHSVTAHGVKEHQAVDQVVGVVLQGLGYALAHCLQTGKVDDRVDVGVLGKESLHLSLVAQLGFYKGNFFAGDLLHPAQGFLGRVDQIVCYHDLIARLDKLHTGMAANIAGAAADQNRHGKHSFQNKRAAAQMGRFDPKFIPSL